jgi:hypothetical protein
MLRRTEDVATEWRRRNVPIVAKASRAKSDCPDSALNLLISWQLLDRAPRADLRAVLRALAAFPQPKALERSVRIDLSSAIGSSAPVD